MFKQEALSLFNKMSAKSFLIVVGLVILSHVLVQATNVSDTTKKVKETLKESTDTAVATTVSKIIPGKSNSTAPATTADKKQDNNDTKKDKVTKVDTAKAKQVAHKGSLSTSTATAAAVATTSTNKAPLGDKVQASSGVQPRDLTTAEGHHGKKYVLVKKKPKHKKIKMEVYKPKMKYKKVTMKVPVKKMKKKKVKGYLVKKHKHH